MIIYVFIIVFTKQLGIYIKEIIHFNTKGYL